MRSAPKEIPQRRGANLRFTPAASPREPHDTGHRPRQATTFSLGGVRRALRRATAGLTRARKARPGTEFAPGRALRAVASGAQPRGADRADDQQAAPAL
ncbi:hypothetical protein Acsp03_08360 [Actinomadura sp. NBRC 104412]|nr:hypothetical protein Acsp03_08360 [Actinomadura sp. NBRC 104412]